MRAGHTEDGLHGACSVTVHRLQGVWIRNGEVSWGDADVFTILSMCLVENLEASPKSRLVHELERQFVSGFEYILTDPAWRTQKSVNAAVWNI